MKLARRSLAAGVALAASTAAHAAGAGWIAERPDADTVATVWTHIEHKDCSGAVKALNAGVAKGYPSVLLLAGGMYEQGVCLKADWSKAAGFYERAHSRGHPRAAAKLASGFLTPAAGPDVAAGLWWALRDGVALPSPCVEPKPLLDDPDRFVAALRAWPAAQLAACAYTAGVMSTIGADMEFSSRAQAHGLRGEIRAVFVPAEGKVDVVTDDLDFIQMGGAVSGDAVRDRDSVSVKREFERDLRAAADRALKRYEQPAAINPSWRSTVSFKFTYVLR